jgi:formyl-CoA transferase
MRLGDTANDDAADFGKPLDGVRILAVEQMQALPWGTQLLARLGAEVVKIEHPVDGESGRGSVPFMTDPDGRRVGCTYLRNNLGKRSVGIDLKKGRELILDLAGGFDIFAENFKGGAMARMGLGYEDLSARYPELIYVSVSGFGNTAETRYGAWPAYAGVAEAMSGIYEWARPEGQPPVINPVGGLGDIGSAMFAVVGILAALRHRDRTGLGQYVDIAMYDAMVAMTDVVTNFWSMGVRGGRAPGAIITGFAARDGYFMVQVGREHQFRRFAEIVGHPEWLTDDRFATREGWVAQLEPGIRPGVEAWAADKSKLDVCFTLSDAGVACGPCNSAEDVVHDPHLAARHMLVEVPRVDGVEQPILVPGNPVKLSRMTEGPETRMPWVGEHTAEVLGAELGLDEARLAELRAAGVIK